MPTHIQWFNYQRNNHYKDGSPLKLLKESKENAYAEGQETSRDSYPPEIFNLTPLAGQAVLLDNYRQSLDPYGDAPHINKMTGYNLPVKYILKKIFP